MYRLCWIPKGWNTPDMFRGITHCMPFDSLEQLKEVMSRCFYNGEWVEDSKGNKLDIDLKEICFQKIW